MNAPAPATQAMPPMTTLDALIWCRQHNASARWQSNGTVSVWANGLHRRRGTFLDAVIAVGGMLAAPPKPAKVQRV